MQSIWTDKVKAWIADHREEMIADIVRLVRIKSVSDKNSDVKPFGQGCIDALHAMLDMAEGYGFSVRNYDNTVGEIDLGREGEDIGFWGHLDVVPEGNGWDYPPYEGVVEHGLIIGRGSQDNKGQTVAVLYVLRCIKELNIPLSHNLKMFVGTNEEVGMEDLTWFLKHYEAPSFSIIADSNYPVCYGEKGIITAHYTGPEFSDDVVNIWGGVAPNVVPDKAGAVLRWTDRFEDGVSRLKEIEGITVERDGDTAVISAAGRNGHTAFPQGALNAIRVLTHAICGSGVLAPEDQKILDFCDCLNDDCYGSGLSINMEDDMSGKLTCVGSMVSMSGRSPRMTINIRYPITGESGWILERLNRAADENHFELDPERVDPAHYFPKDHPVVGILTDVFNDITGLNQKPFVLAGGTYARKFKNSISFGMGFTGVQHPDKKGFFRPGHGGAHGPDECAIIEQLTTSIHIFVEGLLAIDHLKL